MHLLTAFYKGNEVGTGLHMHAMYRISASTCKSWLQDTVYVTFAHHGRSLLIKRTVLKILRNLSRVDLDLKR